MFFTIGTVGSTMDGIVALAFTGTFLASGCGPCTGQLSTGYCTSGDLPPREPHCRHHFLSSSQIFSFPVLELAFLMLLQHRSSAPGAIQPF